MLGLIEDWHKTLHLDPQEEDTWRGAASQFRLPYWDWARKQAYAQDFAIPQVCTWDTVDIIMPNGQKKKDFPNPLVKFRNPPLKDGKIIAIGDELMEKNKMKDDDPRDKNHPNLHILPVSRANYLPAHIDRF